VIVCRSAAELERMREAAVWWVEVLTELGGGGAGRHDGGSRRVAEKRILRRGALPAFKGITGIPRRFARRSTTR
jgi:hypothetical protein